MQAESGSRTPRAADASAETAELPRLHAPPRHGKRDHYTWVVRYQIPRVASSFEKFRHPCGWCWLLWFCSAQPPGRRGAGSHRIKTPPLDFNHSIAHMSSIAQGVLEILCSRGRATPVAFTEIARRDPLPRRLSLATHNNAKTVRQAMESCQTLNRPRSRLSSWSFPDQSRPALAPPPNQMRRLAKTAGRQ
jgi:hypothetical protein